MPNKIPDEFYNSLIGTKISHFKINRLIGCGAMGIVFEAYDEDLDRIVAFKILKKDLMDKKTLVKRFKIEALNIAKLSHPNIVNVFTVGEDKDYTYIVMEYVSGKNFVELINDPNLQWYDYLYLIKIIAMTLKEAHDNNVIHRDIKPANIILNEKKIIKIVDFGLSKYINKDRNKNLNITRINEIVGSPLYLAPELWESNRNLTPFADVYSLGVVLYECLTKIYPYDGDGMKDIYNNIHTMKYTPVSILNPTVPIEIDILINNMLEKDYLKRITMEKVVDSIDRIMIKYNKLNHNLYNNINYDYEAEERKDKNILKKSLQWKKTLLVEKEFDISDDVGWKNYVIFKNMIISSLILFVAFTIVVIIKHLVSALL